MKHSFLNKLSLLAASASLLVAGLSFNNNVNKVSADEPIAPALQEGKNIVITAHYEKDSKVYDAELTGVADNKGAVTKYDSTPSCSYILTVEYGLVVDGVQTIRLKTGSYYLKYGGSSTDFSKNTNPGDDLKYCWLCTGNSETGYKMQNASETSRFIALSDNSGSPKFACYTVSASYINRLNIFDADLLDLQNDLDTVDAYFGLGYSYQKSSSFNEEETTSNINIPFLGSISGNSYTTWSDKECLTSHAVYAGNCKKYNSNYIQLRDSENSGIVTTTSAGETNKVNVVWNNNTADERLIEIYGKNTPYSTAADLYSAETQGEKVGEIAKGTTSVILSKSCKYIGILAYGGALYLENIEIVWKNFEFESADFRLKVAVDEKMPALNSGLDYAYGIEVSTTNKIKKYDFKANAPLVDDVAHVMYQVIGLGDVLSIENRSRLTEEFTIRAYVEYKGDFAYSMLFKTYSVASLLKDYYKNETTKPLVANTYDLLVTLGAIVEA